MYCDDGTQISRKALDDDGGGSSGSRGTEGGNISTEFIVLLSFILYVHILVQISAHYPPSESSAQTISHVMHFKYASSLVECGSWCAGERGVMRLMLVKVRYLSD